MTLKSQDLRAAFLEMAISNLANSMTKHKTLEHLDGHAAQGVFHVWPNMIIQHNILRFDEIYINKYVTKTNMPIDDTNWSMFNFRWQ